MPKARVKKMSVTSGHRVIMSCDTVEILEELEEHYTIRWFRDGAGVLTDTIKKDLVEVIEE